MQSQGRLPGGVNGTVFKCEWDGVHLGSLRGKGRLRQREQSIQSDLRCSPRSLCNVPRVGTWLCLLQVNKLRLKDVLSFICPGLAARGQVRRQPPDPHHTCGAQSPPSAPGSRGSHTLRLNPRRRSGGGKLRPTEVKWSA